ncbi:hypothetical protein Pla175_44350 [Pirellulimonas nuda]|uniref:Uncharacterized protein n=1 Tax=Pirellulimonas nuda TaxID=2528009 RepID=A0A518DHR0_9BACT|nr:hypothetical protein [Pirellulimonas nuda]QDU91019.1 hypothetical protein Pla175_44350 [Pirellulimonas nuda]
MATHPARTEQARIDGPHGPVRPPAERAQAERRPARVAASGSAALQPEQVDPATLQASELVARLAAQQEELDRRVALIESQEAEVESKLRNARLWLDGQRQELDAREAQLEQREKSVAAPTPEGDSAEIKKRAAELDARQAELYQKLEKLAHDRSRCDAELRSIADREERLAALTEAAAEERRRIEASESDLSLLRAELAAAKEENDRDADDLARREAQLAVRRQEVSTALKRFESLGKAEQEIAKLREAAAQFSARARYLEDAEGLLEKDGAAVAEERRELHEQRMRLQEQAERERRELAAEQAAQQTDARRTSERLAAREAELDQRQSALEQVHAELSRSQREVLEMRLATEETWSQLTGALAPASLARSIAQVRARLADHYQHVTAELAERRRDLDEVSRSLEARAEGLETRRADISSWAKRNEEDLERRAAQLVARERELDRQQQHYEKLEQKWSAERGEYRAQIRRLLAELRQETMRAAA